MFEGLYTRENEEKEWRMGYDHSLIAALTCVLFISQFHFC